jgi:uncharacterized protein (DUF58 family)
VQLRVKKVGWLYLLVCTMVGLAAVRQNMPMVFVIFGAMLGGTAISATYSRAMIRAVGVSRELPQRAWQYEPMHFGYFLRNARRRGACLGLELCELRPEGIEDATGYCLHLPPRQLFRAGSRIAAHVRGKIQLSGIRVATQFPFGLVTVFRDMVQPSTLIVWPAKGALRRDPLLHGAMEASSAPPSRVQGGQDEFFGLREYRVGDNPRWIHWKRSASRRTPVVREMSRPVPDTLFVVLDAQPTGEDADAVARREQLLQFAATVVDYAIGRDYFVGLAVADGRTVRVLPPAMGVEARCALLDCLALLPLDGEDYAPLPTVIEHIAPPLVRNAQTMVISADPARLNAHGVDELASHSRTLHVYTPEEIGKIFQPNPLRDEAVASSPSGRKEGLGAAAKLFRR